MAKFIIEPHFRLHEWVAEEKGYFRDEGLDYEFRELVRASDGKIHDKGDKVGAFQSFEDGRQSSVSCACRMNSPKWRSAIRHRISNIIVAPTNAVFPV